MSNIQSFLLPDPGEGLTEADIIQWLVAEGDAVEINQVIVEIETAKSVVELPSPFAGVVHKILVSEGQTAEVGTPIIQVATTAGAGAGPGADEVDGADGADGADGQDDGAGQATLVGYGQAPASGGRRRRRHPHHQVQTSEAQKPAAQSLEVPTTAQSLETPAEPPAQQRAPQAQPPVPPSAVGVAASAASPGTNARVLTKPPVRKLARDLGVNLTAVTPTGPGGIVTREDVIAHHQRTDPKTLATYEDDESPWLASGVVSEDGRQTRVPVMSVRKRTAEAMVSSAFSAPHVTVFQTVDVTKTMKLVKRLRADREFADVRVTPLLIAAKALILAVNRHPQINASWNDERQEIVYKHYVNLGIAATTPRGLIVPNIKDAHRLGLLDLAKGLGKLTQTARAGKTTLRDMSDGTITITNVGVFGIDTGTPILTPGEAAILAFGAITQRPWVHKGKIKPRWVTQLALSFDHRLVDGELGSRVLADVAAVMAEPAQGLVWN